MINNVANKHNLACGQGGCCGVATWTARHEGGSYQASTQGIGQAGEVLSTLVRANVPLVVAEGTTTMCAWSTVEALLI